jgi:hypothetical protein
VTRLESSEGISRLIVASEDMMKFKTIKLLLEFPYLLTVCCHVGVVTIQILHDLIDDELRVPMDAQAINKGLIFRNIVGHAG